MRRLPCAEPLSRRKDADRLTCADTLRIIAENGKQRKIALSMKNRSEKLQKFLYALPAAGIVLISLAMAVLWAVALCYAIALQVAWESVMAFFTLFGLSFIGAGVTVISVRGFFVYMRKVWYDRWPDAPGARLFVRTDSGSSSDGAPAASEGGNAADFAEETSGGESPAKSKLSSVFKKTTLKNAKNESSSVIVKPKYLTWLNLGYALFVLAVICVIVSAALGSMNSEAWVSARSEYMLSHGWFADSVPERPEYDVNEVTAINIDITERDVIVRYDTSANKIEVSYYNLYPDEYVITKEAVGTSLYILNIVRSPEPAHDDPIDVMLDLCFQPNRIEKQVVITIPAAYRDKVEINGGNIIYAKP